MPIFYADTSVLLKQHVDESGASWVQNLVDSPETIMTIELSIVEVYSGFSRLVREGRLTRGEYQELSAELDDLFETRYALIPTSTNVFNIACELIGRHPLRAYDSIHLASAILADQELVSTGKPRLTFLSADHRLLTAATGEGLSTFNPAAAT